MTPAATKKLIETYMATSRGVKERDIVKSWVDVIKKKTKTCPVCGHENHKDANKCTNCGADISDVK